MGGGGTSEVDALKSRRGASHGLARFSLRSFSSITNTYSNQKHYYVNGLYCKQRSFFDIHLVFMSWACLKIISTQAVYADGLSVVRVNSEVGGVFE
jgi:hypothetical protein